jgi:hypothetical protein
MTLGRLAIISVEAAENVSNEELGAELRKRLQSKSFSIERITIFDEQRAEPVLDFIRNLDRSG